VLRAARWKYRTQKIAKKSPSGHHTTTLSGYIFATKAPIDNRKNLLSINSSSTSTHNMVNFGPLAAEIVSLVWGTPANLVVGVSQTLRRWTQGVAYIRQGGHHVGHWPTFLVSHKLLVSSQYLGPLHGNGNENGNRSMGMGWEWE